MPYNRGLYFIILLFACQIANAQVNRYMVFFKDKDQSIYSTTNPLSFLSQKAIDRRIKQNIVITEADVPVNQNYVQEVKNTGASVFFKTRWQNGVLIECDQSLIPTIMALDFVKSYELVAPGSKLLMVAQTASKRVKNMEGRSAESTTTLQLQMLGIDSMHIKGYRGEGITIAVLDSGFPGVDYVSAFDSLRLYQRLDLASSYDFIYNTQNVFQYDNHGTEVLSVLAGYIQNEFTGAAYRATFQLYVTEDDPSENRIEEYNWLFAAERADSAGVDIITSSLGYNTFDDFSMDYEKSDMDGVTTVISQAAQSASERGILVVCSAGNEGANSWKIVTAPADANDVIAVANVNAQGIRSTSSSIGPTADGRIKPDLAALGTSVSIIKPSGAISTASGTSFASPLIAGLAAGVWQRYPHLTNTELIDLLKKSASQYNNPDNALGYGVPNFIRIDNKDSVDPFIDIFPNPFTDTVNIQLQNVEENTVCQLDVLSQQGQLICTRFMTFNSFSPTYNKNLEALTSGLYFFKISCGKNNYVLKVFKR
jgi:serine protease AprX